MQAYHYSYCASRRTEKKQHFLSRIVALLSSLLDVVKPVCIGALAGIPLASALSYTPSLFVKHTLAREGIQLLSDRAISDNAAEVLAKAQKRLVASELYRPGMKFKVYLCNNHWLYLLASSFRWNSMGAHVSTTGRMMIDLKSLSSNESFVRSVAHEITHSMIRQHVGWRVMMLPKWVTEGYAEYVAHGAWSTRDARSELLQMQSESDDHEDYGQYRLMVTYALKVKGIPLQSLLFNPPAAREVVHDIQTQPMDRLMDSILGNQLKD